MPTNTLQPPRPTLSEVTADLEAARLEYEMALGILLKHRGDLASVESLIAAGSAVEDPSLYSSQRNLTALVKDLKEEVADKKVALEIQEGRQRRMDRYIVHLKNEFLQLIPDSQQELVVISKMRKRAVRENDKAALQRIFARENRVRATVGYWLGLLHEVGVEGSPGSIDEALNREA